MPRVPKKNETGLLQALAISEENEREYIARQIHQVNTLLSLVKMNQKKAARYPNNKELSDQLLNNSIQAIDESMHIISRSVRELAPPMFSRVGYVAALDELCRRSNTEEKKVKLEILKNAHVHIAPSYALQLYRLSETLLKCLLENAGARTVHITLGGTDKKVQLRFAHDGKDVVNGTTRREIIEARVLLAKAKLRSGKQWIQVQTGHGKED